MSNEELNILTVAAEIEGRSTTENIRYHALEAAKLVLKEKGLQEYVVYLNCDFQLDDDMDEYKHLLMEKELKDFFSNVYKPAEYVMYALKGREPNEFARYAGFHEYRTAFHFEKEDDAKEFRQTIEQRLNGIEWNFDKYKVIKGAIFKCYPLAKLWTSK
jgi:hypothetical protein